MPQPPSFEADWRRSKSCAGSNCVEVAEFPDGSVALRNSNSPDPVIHYTRSEWRDFLSGAKRGDFDDLS